jgi:hypothetical protein
MIRNRSTGTITASCADIEGNVVDDSRLSMQNRMMGGSKKWFFLFTAIILGLVGYIYVIAGSTNTSLIEHKLSKEHSYEQLTIVMNTFKRNDMMLGTSLPLSSLCCTYGCSVSHI